MGHGVSDRSVPRVDQLQHESRPSIRMAAIGRLPRGPRIKHRHRAAALVRDIGVRREEADQGAAVAINRFAQVRPHGRGFPSRNPLKPNHRGPADRQVPLPPLPHPPSIHLPGERSGGGLELIGRGTRHAGAPRRVVRASQSSSPAPAQGQSCTHHGDGDLRIHCGDDIRRSEVPRQVSELLTLRRPGLNPPGAGAPVIHGGLFSEDCLGRLRTRPASSGPLGAPRISASLPVTIVHRPGV